MKTATRVETIPPITRAEVEGLARTEYALVAVQLRSLAAGDWSKPTDCPRWDVRAVAGHSAGMLASHQAATIAATLAVISVEGR